MEDIDLARSVLEQDKQHLVIVKKGQVLVASGERGIGDFFRAVKGMGKDLHNAAVADRIVGSAVAMLCLHARVASVYGEIASQKALDMLHKKGVAAVCRDKVPYISNHDGTDLCPFEKMAATCRKPSKLFEALQAVFAEGGQ